MWREKTSWVNSCSKTTMMTKNTKTISRPGKVLRLKARKTSKKRSSLSLGRHQCSERRQARKSRIRSVKARLRRK